MVAVIYSSKKTTSLTRRDTIAGLAASAASPFLSSMAAAEAAKPSRSFGGLHERVARHVRELTVGQNIKLSLLLPDGSRGNVAPVVAKFFEMTGVDVTIFQTPVDDINTELSLDAMSNSQRYDLALPATFGLPGLVAAGALLPMTELAAQYEPTGFRDDILFGVGDSFDGELFGFQADGDAYVMFYNKAMLTSDREAKLYEDRYGQKLRTPVTWQELDRQMAHFHRPDEDQWGGLLFRTPGYLAWEWWVRFHSKGIWPFSEDMDPQVASGAGVQALEEMIRATQSLHPLTSRLGLFDNWKKFSEGQTYCNIGWGGTQKYLNAPHSNMRGNMIHGPTPGGVVDASYLGMPYFNWGWNYVVSSSSRHPELSYLFALFASSPSMSTLAVRQADGFFDPYRPEHYEDEGIKAAYTQEFLDVHRASLEASIPDLYLKDQAAYFRVLQEWLARAMEGDVSPQEALERVARRWQLITNASGKAVQKERWARLKQKYPARIRNALKDV